MSFGLDNLPYGSVIDQQGRRRAAVRYDTSVLDLTDLAPELFETGTLDRLLAAGPDVWSQVRARVTEVLQQGEGELIPLDAVRPVLPFTPGDYVDFYASEHHATNAGRIFRPGADPLPPSWRHQPIGYYGRSAALQASGTPVHRPSGHVRTDSGDSGVAFRPTERLDFEAELAFVVGAPSEAGRPVSVAAASRHVFGVALLNDWSARDIQAFETVPLGPFLGKSFATSISPWITPLAALEGARTASSQHPLPLPHLHEAVFPHGLALDLEVSVNGTVVSRPGFAAMYWSYAQLLAHLTSNGAAVRTGDVFASGTVSGPRADQRGCLLELTWNGTEPLTLDDGSSRTWLQDGDEVTITASHESITLGEVTGRIMP
jgi:fumarylacetoacetase